MKRLLTMVISGLISLTMLTPAWASETTTIGMTVELNMLSPGTFTVAFEKEMALPDFELANTYTELHEILLDDNDLERISQGESIHSLVSVTQGDLARDQLLIEQTDITKDLSAHALALDITIKNTLFDKDQRVKDQKDITEISKPITLQFKAPEDLDTTQALKSKMMAVHLTGDGVYHIYEVPLTYYTTENMYAFQPIQFSDYVFYYSKVGASKPAEPTKPAPASETKKEDDSLKIETIPVQERSIDNPYVVPASVAETAAKDSQLAIVRLNGVQTGDTAPIAILIAIMVVSIITLVGYNLHRKKKE